jgi:hypothetical protein
VSVSASVSVSVSVLCLCLSVTLFVLCIVCRAYHKNRQQLFVWMWLDSIAALDVS